MHHCKTHILTDLRTALILDKKGRPFQKYESPMQE